MKKIVKLVRDAEGRLRHRRTSPVRDHYKPLTLVQHGLDMYRRPTYKPGTKIMFDGIDKVYVVGRHMELRRAE